jgi:hypothetical protein
VAEEIDSVKARLAVLRKKKRPSKAGRADMASARRELNALVNAPVSGGRNPFDWLPDELILMILERVPFEALWSGACDRVCLRWAQLMESAPVKRHKRDGRWAAYEAGVIKPRGLDGHTSSVGALAVGLDGKVYSGSDDQTIRVWSGDDGTHLQTLEGHAIGVAPSQWGWMAKSTRGRMTRRFECGRATMAHTYRRSRGTHTESLLSLWGWTARCTRGRRTGRFECGRVTLARTS